MKKLLALLLGLAVILALPAGTAEKAPEKLTCGDFEYILKDDGTAEIVGYTGTAETLDIPDALDGHAVTGIDDWAFSHYNRLTSIAIPDGVTTIGINPFWGCYHLSRITVSPDHPVLATIDGVLFSKADKLLVCYPSGLSDEAYAIPQGIEIIGDSAFSACRSLTSVAIPDSVTAIGESAFYFCAGLKSVTLPGSVTAIGIDAFSDCPNLILTVPRDSCAAEYCRENGLNYTYPDANDWLNN